MRAVDAISGTPREERTVSSQLSDLLGPRPGQGRRHLGRVREGRYLRPGARPLSRSHEIWPPRTRLVVLPGRILYIVGHA